MRPRRSSPGFSLRAVRGFYRISSILALLALGAGLAPACGSDVEGGAGGPIVYNRAFCTLAKTSGWTTRKAFEVFHDANAVYWAPNETFDGGACGVEQAAADRGYTVNDVVHAFGVVGVSCSSAPR